MKKILVGLAALGALVAVLGLASTGFAGESVSSAQSQYGGPDHAGGPAQDTLYGGGRYGGATTDGSEPFFVSLREFSIDAHSNPVGGGAYGTLAIGNPSNGNLNRLGEVTCLSVDGNSAVAGGFIRESVDPSIIGGIFFVYFKDFGRAGAGTLDRGSGSFTIPPGTTDPDLPKGFPRECTPVNNNAFGVGYVPFTAGDVVIHDE